MTAPEQADTIFSKDDDPFVAIKILCFFFSLLSKAKLLFGEEAVIVSLILDIYIYIEVEEERGPTRQSIGPLFFFFSFAVIQIIGVLYCMSSIDHSKFF
jgi:hypothetical protein